MTRNGFGRTQGKGVALHLSDIKTSLRAFTTFSSTSTTPNANSRLFNERLQNRDANHGARLHDEPAKRPTLHLVTLQEHRRLGGAAESRNIPSSVACMSNSACRTVSHSAYNTLLLERFCSPFRGSRVAERGSLAFAAVSTRRPTNALPGTATGLRRPSTAMPAPRWRGSCLVDDLIDHRYRGAAAGAPPR